MLKDNELEFDGTVIEVLGGGYYKIDCSNNHYIRASSSGKIKKNKIKIVVGDSVKVITSNSHLFEGRIVLRHK